MRHYVSPSRIIKVDGTETYLLSHWVSDNGIVIEVSGPQVLRLDEHEATEYDGSELKLDGKLLSEL